ncbi:MAG: TauD/TfdA family dioxygenase [Alphaproteobacteria bacterium]|nr:TauD/TfdA family dioxygenase [Alphaproteobacteria bacterium]
MAASPRWIRALDAAQLAELDAATRAATRRGLAWERMTADDFPLPGWAGLIADLRDELENGCSMVQLRGLPVERYDEDALRVLWFGLGRALGTPVFQNCRGELMRAIRDEGASIGRRYGQIETGGAKPFLSSYARTLSNGPLRFHTDRCDVVGLLCVRQAEAGGVSKLASSAMVHNAMLERRPDLAAELYGDIWRSRFGEEAGGESAPYPLPIFDQRDGRFTSHYSLTYIEAAQLLPAVPKLTAAQREAIDLLMALAEELSFTMRFAPGDIQLLNNHVIYHGRTPFTDDAAAGHDRLLLRLWLAMPNCRALPESHCVLWGAVEAGAQRGGIGQQPLAPA